jgi:tetratricopeptide (TPR) repeat protein
MQQDPESHHLRLKNALELERAGRADESLAALEQLARETHDSPELLVHLVRALRFAGREAEAEARTLAALARWPVDVPLHRLLAELRFGAGADCAAKLEQAIAEFPEALQLRLVAAEVLRNAGAPDRGLALLEEGLRRAPGAAAFETSIGVLLGDLGRHADALRYQRSACARLPGSVQMQRNLIPALLRADEPREALDLIDALLPLAPDDQLLYAHRATALRMCGDPRYADLADYARLVRRFSLGPPAGFADIGEFNAALAPELAGLHRGERRPLAQSVFGGTQTQRNLPTGNPLVAALFAMFDAPIREYIAGLDVARGQHPTDRRRSSSYRIAGSWSVLLKPGGHHANHVHPQGWISSAYYVDVPPAGGEPRAGWLRFGEPNPAAPRCEPEMFIEPVAGMLVLFPSFMWHGTVPFTHGTRRLTVAFDVVPADGSR